jgi:hypothetical protein
MIESDDYIYFSRGWTAAETGLEPSDIPYHVDSHEGHIWLSGFYEFMEEFGKQISENE